MWRPITTGTKLAVVMACLACASAHGGEPAGSSKNRPQDQIWLVSTRDLGCVGCRLTQTPTPNVWRYDEAGNSWQGASVDKFLATDDPEIPTSVFVHGNWNTIGDSVQVAFDYYRHQIRHAPSDRPLRLVIWSWPSTRGRRPLRDVRAKYARTDTEGQYLAWLLGRIDPQVRVSLVGYSFGAPIVTGALHNLAVHGETLAGRPVGNALRGVPAGNDRRVPYRAVLIAAAQNSHALSTGAEHELALTQVDRMLVLINSCDPALQRFRRVDRCTRAQALGYRGASGSLGRHAAKVTQIDVSGIVGRQHNWLPYLGSTSSIAEIQPCIWFDDSFAR